MVTSAIVRSLADAIPQLAIGQTLFTEFGRGEKCAIVNLVSQTGDKDVPELRYGAVNVFLKGYSVAEGIPLANNIVKTILTLEGASLINPLDESITYKLVSIYVRGWPVPFSTPDGQQITANVTINFKELTGE